MRWLVRLVTPPGGVVLDPFAGTGSTLQAARDEGFHAIGIERDEFAYALARQRLGFDRPAADAPVVELPRQTDLLDLLDGEAS
jgi:DNA modification methylase